MYNVFFPQFFFSQQYLEQAQDLVFNENVLLQTLGFDVAIDHPHTHVVRCCHLVRGEFHSKYLFEKNNFLKEKNFFFSFFFSPLKMTNK